MSNDQEETEALEKSKQWMDKIKDDWEYKKKLVVFEDEDGNRVTPTTTTTTTTTTTLRPNITGQPTPKPTTYSSVVIITGTTEGPITEAVSSADTSQILKIVGITCGSLVGLVIIVALLIKLCRRSSEKKNRRISLRRPLHGAEPDVDHIYAEIEPLQLQRSESPGGASGSSGDVQLPRKKGRKRQPGISSFRAISTRIYRFFNVETDDQQSVFYNRSGHQATLQGTSGAHAPEPPERNIVNGNKRTKKGRVQRGESTASRRPLLDGDSVVSTSSTGPELRSNIYNPLMKEQGVERQSGPYDHLTMPKTLANQSNDPENRPESQHDYFTLEKANRESQEETSVNNNETVESGTILLSDTLSIEDEVDKMDTILEDDEVVGTPKHDYFVLEPHEREDSNTADVNQNDSPSKRSIKSNQSSAKSAGSGSPMKVKPEAKPRVTKSAASGSPMKELNSSASVDKADETVTNRGETEKDEVYVLSKLGDAPEPPEAKQEPPDTGDDDVVDEYLTPKDVQRQPEYVDVLPNPPPRSTSLQPHELLETHQSSLANDTKINQAPKETNHSPTRQSPTKHSQTPTKHSPTRSPTKHSPTRSPTKHLPTKHSPAKQAVDTSSSTTTDV